MNKKKIILTAGVVLVLAVAGFWIFGKKNAQGKVDFVTEKVTRGNISYSITATGTIEPVTEVEVGTQVSGIIDKIYIDYNSVVKQGEVIAEMDKVTLLSDLQSAQATYNGAKAEYDYQQKLYTRNKALHEKQLISETDYEQSVYDYERAKSTYEQTQAALAKAERNLSYATITSPINGIVTSKDVEEGQTVASGFETPTLLTDHPVDLIFLDIQMPELNGLEFSKIVPGSTRIIFTTAFGQYALDGYKVNAHDYLLKPISYTDFMTAVNKAVQWFELRQKAEASSGEIQSSEDLKYIYVKSDYKLIQIELDKILYIEGLKDYIKIHLEDNPRPILSLVSMKMMEDKLPANRFIRIHRSFIVQKQKIKIIEKGRIVFGKDYIPISDSYKQELQNYVNKHTV